MTWRKNSGGESSPGASPRCSNDERERQKVPRGHIPMVTECGERVMVPVRLLTHPRIAELLDMAAQQYGYDQPAVLRIPCDAVRFRAAVHCALQS